MGRTGEPRPVGEGAQATIRGQGRKTPGGTLTGVLALGLVAAGIRAALDVVSAAACSPAATSHPVPATPTHWSPGGKAERRRWPTSLGPKLPSLAIKVQPRPRPARRPSASQQPHHFLSYPACPRRLPDHIKLANGGLWTLYDLRALHCGADPAQKFGEVGFTQSCGLGPSRS